MRLVAQRPGFGSADSGSGMADSLTPRDDGTLVAMTTPRHLLLLALPLTAAVGPLLAAGPVMAFRILAVAVLAVAVVDGVRARRVTRAQWVCLGLAGLVCISAAVTHAWPTWPGSGIIELASLVGALLLAAALAEPGTDGQWLWLARGITLALLVEAGVVAWEVVSGQHLPSFALTWDDDRYMGTWFLMAGTFTNPNQLAHMVATAFPITVWLACRERGLLRAAAIAAAVLSPWVMWETGSRIGLLAMAAELALLVLLWRRGWLVLAGIIAAGGVALVAAPGILEAIWPSGKDAFSADDPRLNLIVNGFWMLHETYGLGVGPGGFASWASLGPRDVFELTNPHNAVMEVLTQYGVVVALAFLAVAVAVAREAVSALRSSDRARRWLGLGTLGVLALWPLIGMANSQWQPLSWSILEVAALAACHAELRRRRENAGSGSR